ncbi:MAG: GDSL-type esterase/lipase family protein [Planctomycetota bacterium]|nr:GDSL-type esterase/lipase family protein [Planctomycetota bacterium]
MKFLSKYSTLWIGLLAFSGVQCAGGGSSSGGATDPCSGDRPGSPCFVTRVMCIGDSNTQGVQGQASYRYPLWFELGRANSLVDFVGTRFTVDAEDGITIPTPSIYPDYYTDFDRDHEGYDGLRTDQVLPLLPPVVAGQVPDVCLIMLGTNDVGQRGISAITSGVDSMQEIVESVRSQAPATMFLIATIPPIGDGFWYFQNAVHVAGFNSHLAASVPQWSTPESPAILVDVHGAIDVNTDMLADGVHLNAAGQAKAAQVMSAAMAGALDGGLLPPSMAMASLQESSFETLGLVDGAFSDLPLMDWRYPDVASLKVGTLNPAADTYMGADQFQTPSGGDGDEVLALENMGGDPGLGWVYQTLPTTLEPGLTYDLEVAVGQRLPGNSRGTTAYGGYEVQMLAGNRVIASSSNQVTPVPGTLASDRLIVATDDLEHAPLGSPIVVRLRMTWSDPGAATDFDWVRMNVY